MKYLYLLIIPAAAAATLAAVSDSLTPAEKLLARTDTLVIGHRGYPAAAPENTLPAFRMAKAAGADMVELDYYVSRDGCAVVFHDATLDRTSNAVEKWGVKKIPVGERTVAELKQLDAGKWYGEPFAGTTIPTLAEALDCIQDGGVTLIERKQGPAADCVRLLRERGEINRVIVQAFDWKFLAEFHALEPKQILGALGPPATKEGRKLTDAEKSLNAAYAAEARAAGARVIGWNSLVSRDGVAAAHAAGLEVWVYTINSADEAKALVAAGVDGIITDNPPLIRRAVAAPAAR